MDAAHGVETVSLPKSAVVLVPSNRVEKLVFLEEAAADHHEQQPAKSYQLARSGLLNGRVTYYRLA